MANQPIPDGYHTVTPYLIVDGAAPLIDFLKQAFEATEKQRRLRPDGSIMHAEVRVGDSIVMLADASTEYPPMPSALHLYVPDTDTFYQRALRAGATSLMAPENQSHGDRMAGVKDAVGNSWWIATPIEAGGS
jgi:PhnB protein